MTTRPETVEILRHLHGKPGHDEVKADFRQLLVAEFDVPLSDVRFEQRIEVKSRTDALIGRTVFEAKKDLVREWADVERKMPDYLATGNRKPAKPSSASLRTVGFGECSPEKTTLSSRSRKRFSIPISRAISFHGSMALWR